MHRLNKHRISGGQLGKRRPEGYFKAGIGFPFGVLLVFVVFLFQALVQLAFAAAVHFGLVPVFTEVFGNEIPVGIKIQHDKRSVECLAQKSEQQ
jgi:hypothetical protein